MAKIQDITNHLETFAATMYQEEYDNAGLIVGNPRDEVSGILISLDSTEDIVEEAIQKKCNLVVAHHPIVFKGLKKLNGKNYVERTVLKAIKNDIALYAIHTNLDNMKMGVNAKIAEKLSLKEVEILAPKKQKLMKLTTFVPLANSKEVLTALGIVGAGQIGEYKNCSFRTEGIGSFQPTEKANPYIGQANIQEEVIEHRIEVVFPIHLEQKIMNALRKAHPYQEIAYYLHLLENENPEIGSGAIGILPEKMDGKDFLIYLKEKMQLQTIRHTPLLNNRIEKVALCGGSGSFLLNKAIQKKADVYISADFKYHEFFDADQKIVIADIGHYESEVFTKELIADFLIQRFEDLQILKSTINTNPIQYFH